MTSPIENKNELKISVKEKFTFSDNIWFRDILNTIEQQNIKNLLVDFSATQFIDSAALGMLLLAREELAKKGGHVQLLNAGGQVEKIFTISHFHSLFEMR